MRDVLASRIAAARRVLAVGAAVALLAGACSTGEPGPEPTSSSSPGDASPPPATGDLPRTALAGFAAFDGVALADPDAPAYPGPATPTSLDGVLVVDPLADDVALPGVGRALESRGFVVLPAGYPLVHFVYDENAYGSVPNYVTTDAAYHVWHLAFDKVLRQLEQETLLPALEELVTGLLDAAGAQAEMMAGTPLADDAAAVEQYFQVAAAELGLPGALGPLAEAEVALIGAASGDPATSPLLGSPVDYSLFTPRGHYTRNEDLERYFLGMTALGQLAFCLPETLGCPDGVRPARLGLLASRLVVADPALAALWRQVYEPTAFLVGLADDYTPFEWAAAATSVSPTWLEDPSVLADGDVARAVDALVATRAVEINPALATVRIMGTRFVLDAFVLDQLIFPNVGTGQDPRTLPSGLDVAAVLGSGLARDVLDDSGALDYANYESQRAWLTAAVAARPAADWGATVYDAWLYALQPVLAGHGAAFPDYLRGPAWAAKDLQTGLASYAELKHDTILYAKQALAEGGGDVPQERRHWVEPEPVAFERLAAVADLTRRGLADRDVLSGSNAALLDEVSRYCAFLARVARAELAGEDVSEADNQKLLDTGIQLERLVFLASDFPADGSSPEGDQDAALVADIATGGPGEYLEIGTARFDRLLVVVPADGGTFQVAVGAVNAYRELVSDERLTDESWRALLDSGDAPARPAWQDVLFAE